MFQNWDAADMNECSMTEKSHKPNPECLTRERRRKFALITIGQSGKASRCSIVDASFVEVTFRDRLK